MTLTLELTPEQQRRLEDEAARRGMGTKDYALALVTQGEAHPAATAADMEALEAVPLPPVNGTGTDLVAYWERAGVLGTRPDITDSLQHARALRRQAERRVRE